ncbi:TetR/AcrR family transcriptional regulator [Cellulomonas gilvus]|uniref:Regulatory protein TetR n=1 Tax=Cellulomonas gilvus (strain ATCC 13127 / NRRL B-14078) TaxID=593907 RepID=F8A0I4_CELGA|nr:TetR/AcrR family transcriptional regulator [Cellulomonas gilvus]AEI11528.1 regulatory protein TetR [Cellulomonas gilvus ATCC 13127]
MGRVQTFDTAQAVGAALRVFWAHGYADASLPELERATGLSRSSIYHAFGSKRGLFDAAVSGYLADVVQPLLRPLVADVVAPDAVLDYLAGLRDALARPGSLVATHGCLLINAAGAPIAHDEAVRATIAAYRADLRHALGRGVAAHLPGLPADERDRLAETCTALVVAAFALVRVDPAAALASIDAARSVLEA